MFIYLRLHGLNTCINSDIKLFCGDILKKDYLPTHKSFIISDYTKFKKTNCIKCCKMYFVQKHNIAQLHILCLIDVKNLNSLISDNHLKGEFIPCDKPITSNNKSYRCIMQVKTMGPLKIEHSAIAGHCTGSRVLGKCPTLPK